MKKNPTALFQTQWVSKSCRGFFLYPNSIHLVNRAGFAGEELCVNLLRISVSHARYIIGHESRPAPFLLVALIAIHPIRRNDPLALLWIYKAVPQAFHDNLAALLQPL